MAQVFVAIGSNLGDRAALVDEATARLGRLGVVLARSAVLETVPVGPIRAQPDFLNCVALVETPLEPLAFLRGCLELEDELGRVRDPARAKGPRTMDLDLVRWLDDDGSERQLTSDELTLPHPALPGRPFWQQSLEELAP